MTILGEPATPPPATRATRPGWRDPRLWIGVLIVALSVVAGARLVGAADESVPVWAVGHDMAAGDDVTADDLVAHRVRFVDPADLRRYFPADEVLPADLQLVQGVGAGELLPRSATAPTGETALLHLPVAVEPTLVPPNVGAGSVVDVWVRSEGRCPACSRAALNDVTVIEAPGTDELSGVRQVVLAVTEEDAGRWFRLLAGLETPTVTIAKQG